MAQHRFVGANTFAGPSPVDLDCFAADKLTHYRLYDAPSRQSARERRPMA